MGVEMSAIEPWRRPLAGSIGVRATAKTFVQERIRKSWPVISLG
jgi:hypothetical protein